MRSISITKLAPLAGLLALLTLSGCDSARLEYDRMTGTQYPQPVTVAGEEVNFTTIFWQGERLLTVVEDTTNIAPLTGPANPLDPNQYDYITAAELETVEANNRNLSIAAESYSCGLWNAFTCTRHHLYGVVVNHYFEDNCGATCRMTGIMGIMYSGYAAGSLDDRSAFANFWKNTTVSGNNGKYLRSAAHEAGHAFNLLHCDGDGSTTIMNQTWKVGDTYTYEFSASSLDHLQNHPDDAVWPGTGTFDTVCPHVH